MSIAWRELRGSRIFFPLALGFGALWVPIWLLRYAGALPLPDRLPAAAWHGHEMIYGYLAAMVAGFLTVGDRGPHVLALASLWALARVLLLFEAPLVLAAAVDVAFLPLLVALRKPPLWRGAKFMSLGIVTVASALALANLWIFLAGAASAAPLRTAAMLLVALLVVVAGRLVPGHTRAATRRGPGLALARTEQASVGLAAALVLSEVAGVEAIAGIVAAALGLLQAYRLWRWRDRAILRDPLLWGLHVGFGWLALGLLALSASRLGLGLQATDALHLILIGAVGTLTLVIAMRLLRAQAREAQRGDRKDGAVLALISLAALVRGILPLFEPGLRGAAVEASGTAWSLAMLLALVLYAPRLLGRRGAGRV